jgi:biotin carboxylase
VQNISNQTNTTRRPRVLLTDTTRWALGARLAISLAKAGCEVSAVCASGVHPLRKLRSVRQVFAYRALRPLPSLAAAIAKVNPDFVIPCDDRAVQHLHEFYEFATQQGSAGERLVALLERSLGAPANHRTVSARYPLLQIAREEGLLVPRSVQLANIDDVSLRLSNELFPWVLKADGTWGGGGVKIAQNLAEAESHFRDLTKIFRPQRALKRLLVNRDGFLLRSSLRSTRPVVSAQSFIHGRPANCAVFCFEGRVLAGIAVEVVRSQGATGPATIVQVVEGGPMMHAAERLASRLALSGFFGLDFVIEDGSDAVYLIEMNPRCTPLCHLQLGKGKDMPAALWSVISGQPVPETRSITNFDRIAYFPDAGRSLEDDFGHAFLDMPEGEPELMHELLNPWPDRSFLYRMFNFMHALKAAPPSQIAFETSTPRSSRPPALIQKQAVRADV